MTECMVRNINSTDFKSSTFKENKLNFMMGTRIINKTNEVKLNILLHGMFYEHFYEHVQFSVKNIGL